MKGSVWKSFAKIDGCFLALECVFMKGWFNVRRTYCDVFIWEINILILNWHWSYRCGFMCYPVSINKQLLSLIQTGSQRCILNSKTGPPHICVYIYTHTHTISVRAWPNWLEIQKKKKDREKGGRIHSRSTNKNGKEINCADAWGMNLSPLC